MLSCYEHSCLGLLWTYTFLLDIYKVRSGTARSYSKQMFHFKRNCLSFPKWFYHFINPTSKMRLPVASHSHQPSVGDLVHSAILTGVRWHLINLHFSND